MGFKKILILAGVIGMVANTAIAAQGDVSIIPQIRFGTGEVDGGSIFGEDLGDEDIDIYGAAVDCLYGFSNNFEAGLGIGIDRNELDETDELDFTSFNLYGLGRYNFNTSNELTPYVSLKAGYKFGDEDFSETESGVTVKAEIETGIFAGIAAGLEYNYFNFEIGYEHTEVDIDASGSDGVDSISDSTDADADVFYIAVGYRFKY